MHDGPNVKQRIQVVDSLPKESKAVFDHGSNPFQMYQRKGR
jgi:hypothetical protein